MKKKITILAIILIAGHCLAEVHGLIWKFSPEVATKQVDLFWKKDFHMMLAIQWYIKMLFDDVFVVICFFVMAKMARGYSERLFRICVVYLVYHIIDALLFMYDYKSSQAIYVALLICSTAAVIGLILPEKNKLKIV